LLRNLTFSGQCSVESPPRATGCGRAADDTRNDKLATRQRACRSPSHRLSCHADLLRSESWRDLVPPRYQRPKCAPPST
jgi:hypothetical protein